MFLRLNQVSLSYLIGLINILVSRVNRLLADAHRALKIWLYLFLSIFLVIIFKIDMFLVLKKTRLLIGYLLVRPAVGVSV